MLFTFQADIMQLDVTWLYDDFEGNTVGATTSEVSSAEVDVVGDGAVYKEGSMSSMPWTTLKNLNAL